VTRNDLALNTSNNDTWGQLMKAQSYRTAFVGKWHLSAGRLTWTTGRQNVPASMRAGFEDEWKGCECRHVCRVSTGANYYDKSDINCLHTKYQPEGEADQIISFLDDHQTNHPTEQFFCVWAANPPHDPYTEYDNGQVSPNKEYYDPLVNSMKPPNFSSSSGVTNTDLASYYTMCTGLDNAMGRVLAKLDALGIRNNTIVVYTSDHGDMMGAHGCKLKMKPWEESINVPLIVRYPNVVPANRVSDALVSSLDFMPSLMSMAGLKDVVPNGIQGKDLSQTMRGHHGKEHESVFIGITDQGDYNPRQVVTPPQAAPAPWVGIRTKQHVYATFEKGNPQSGYGENGGYILFDLKNDPWEMTNLVDLPGNAALQAALWDRLYVLTEESGEKAAGFVLPDRPVP